MGERAHRGSGSHGQAAPVLVVIVVLTGISALVVAHLGAAAVARARARTAADAAALAGAVDGRDAAEAVARANGASIETYLEEGREVEVVARVGQARARARARATGGTAAGELAMPAAGGDRRALAPSLVAALARADDIVGRPVSVTGGKGIVVEVDEADADVLAGIEWATGLCRIDLVHFAPCRTSNGE